MQPFTQSTFIATQIFAVFQLQQATKKEWGTFFSYPVTVFRYFKARVTNHLTEMLTHMAWGVSLFPLI